MRSRLVSLALLVFVGLPAAGDAAVIGQATSARNDVVGIVGSAKQPVGAGSQISANELITTGTDSAALLKFLDATNLSIGASSTVVLDRFVYNPDGSAADAVINITRGAMRFVTGNSDPKNFAINTQVATIGVRGTDFVVVCDGKGTCAVAITKGVVKICPHPLTPIDQCSDGYDIDLVNNFTLIGPNGTKGPQHIDPAVVLRLYAIIANGGKFDVAALTPGDKLLPLVAPSDVTPN